MKQSVEVLDPPEPLFGLNGELAYNFGESDVEISGNSHDPRSGGSVNGRKETDRSLAETSGIISPEVQQEDVKEVSGKVSVPVKRVELTSISGGKWSMEFSSNVSRRDINRLRVMLVIEFNRAKRRERLKRLQSDRRKEGSDE